MQIASVGQQSTVTAVQTPEAKEGPGPDHDGDKDDAGAVKSSPPKGVGSLVDTTA